ncbi:MAG TPA: hypothetical protein VED41_04985 [Solirubrobacteraceae bacterium]|nr:hypothetical protein [Solirubrobacteraceae bacterium]
MRMRFCRSLIPVHLLGVAIVAGALLVPASAAAGRGECQLSIEASAATVTAGEQVTLGGELSCLAGTGVAGETVTVYERERGAGAVLSEVASATVEADGDYKLAPLALNADTLFVARTHRSFGARTLVRVAPKVTFTGAPAEAQPAADAGRTRADRRVTFTFTGTVDPVATAGATVALQRESAPGDEQWRTIAVSAVEPEGRYSFTHSFRSVGEVSLRVVVHSGRENVAVASEPHTYELTATQNPLLTIEGSPAVIVSGQTLTIAGVAAAGAGQPVTLLARTRGHAFAPLAKGTTTAGGAYTFTASPAQETFYRVLDAATASTELHVAVTYALTASVAPSGEASAVLATRDGKLLAQTGEQLTFSGTIAPADTGQTAYLERRRTDGVGWQLLASAKVNEASYSIAHTFAEAGEYVMRIRVPGDGETQSTSSEPLSILIGPAG